jgi:hypothetical protein
VASQVTAMTIHMARQDKDNLVWVVTTPMVPQDVVNQA